MRTIAALLVLLVAASDAFVLQAARMSMRSITRALDIDSLCNSPFAISQAGLSPDGLSTRRVLDGMRVDSAQPAVVATKVDASGEETSD